MLQLNQDNYSYTIIHYSQAFIHKSEWTGASLSAQGLTWIHEIESAMP